MGDDTSQEIPQYSIDMWRKHVEKRLERCPPSQREQVNDILRSLEDVEGFYRFSVSIVEKKPRRTKPHSILSCKVACKWDRKLYTLAVPLTCSKKKLQQEVDEAVSGLIAIRMSI